MSSLDVRLMDLFRAFRLSNEISARALELTTLIINENTSFYPAWNYRLVVLDSLCKSAENIESFWCEELRWLNALTEDNLKSYQIWQHRQNIALRLPCISTSELDLLDEFLTSDAKNYHLWSYRLVFILFYYFLVNI